MLQEYIPPGSGQDWFFHGYFDTGRRCQPAFTGVKDRSYPAYAGLTSLGRSVPNTRLREQVTGLAAAIGFRGIVDLDLRFDPRDAQYKLLDFNPRLGAQFRLFTTGTAASTWSRAAYLDLTGQPCRGRADDRAGASWSRTTTRSARSATGAAASWGCGPGCGRCAGWTRSPGSPAMTCGRSA